MWNYQWLILIGSGMIKFMLTPFVGVGMSLSFIETYIFACLGAIISAVLMYFLSKQLIAFSHRLKVKKKKVKRKFTWTNRMIIRTKWRLGIYGICFYAPLFLSIPVGTVIATKFYFHQKKTLPLIILGITMNGFILTIIAYSKQLLMK